MPEKQCKNTIVDIVSAMHYKFVIVNFQIIEQKKKVRLYEEMKKKLMEISLMHERRCLFN